MYRELVIRAYGKEAIERIDQLRGAGVDMTDFVLSAIMLGDIENILELQKEKRMLVLV
jgi:hypothetical protein